MSFKSLRVFTMFTSTARVAEGASFLYMCAYACACAFFAANNSFVSLVGAINAASIIISAISIILVLIVAVLVRLVALITVGEMVVTDQGATPQVKPA